MGRALYGSAAVRGRLEDGGEVAQARHRRRCADGAEGPPLVCSQQGRRGADSSHLPPPYASAARRLRLYALLASSLPAAPGDQPVAGRGGLEADSGIQGLSHQIIADSM